MALKGIKSVNSNTNFVTPAIEDFLFKHEMFSPATKSIKFQYSTCTSEIKYIKNLGDNGNSTYRCFVTGKEVVVEVFHGDNGTGSEVFNKHFSDEEGFIEVYNKLVDWAVKNI